MLPQRHPQLGAHFGGVGGVTLPTRRSPISSVSAYSLETFTGALPDLVSGFNLMSSETGGRDFSDLTRESGPMVERLRDPAFFWPPFADGGILTWPNGVDID
jgi:hypothetical protein